MESMRYQRSVISSGIIEGYDKGHKKGVKEGHKKGMKEGHEKGLIEGYSKGKKENTLQIAQKAIEKGIPFDAVLELTGLKKDDLDFLKK
jgi:predicted transposase YdaD